jgi:hypothetical protein
VVDTYSRFGGTYIIVRVKAGSLEALVLLSWLFNDTLSIETKVGHICTDLPGTRSTWFQIPDGRNRNSIFTGLAVIINAVDILDQFD